VFISHTAELRDFPKAKSYVAEVERAISAAGHVVVDMSDFPAADQPPAEICVERVRGCDVYVGVLGTRYGSPVRDLPGVSYTELEFNTATEAKKDRLILMLDTDADDVGIPASQLIDREFGDRQDAFRRRVMDSGLVKQSFDSPAMLGWLVERSLRELAETRRRIESGLRREQVPAEPQPVRASRFVNPPPAVAPTWFQDRQIETGVLAHYVTDPGIRMVTVVGRGGIGKTAIGVPAAEAVRGWPYPRCRRPPQRVHRRRHRLFGPQWPPSCRVFKIGWRFAAFGVGRCGAASAELVSGPAPHAGAGDASGLGGFPAGGAGSGAFGQR
jgi:Domain of unknown function (DUF4062)